MRLVLLQSNYLPWKGYFDMIAMSDIMVFHDDVQYTRQDWRNRNLIKTTHGISWITVPCGSNIDRKINEVRLKDGWQRKHFNQIREAYQKARCYDHILPLVGEMYGRSWSHLSNLNQWSIKEICRMLNINTPMIDSADLSPEGHGWQRVLDICIKAGASEYLSGPAGRNYIDEQKFNDAGVEIRWMDYGGYPIYEQMHGDFCHHVSIVDLMANTGITAKKYMKHEQSI